MAEQPATRGDSQGGRLSCRVAPPLTLENVYEAVKRVRDWREFGGWLLLVDHDGNKLDAIHRKHGDNLEACLKAVIEAFLRGEGLRQPSWRRFIHALYRTGENHIAHDIIAYAEPVEDPTMTVDAVTKIMDKIKGDKSEVMRGLDIPEPLLDEILQRKYSSSSEESHAIASAYVNIKPNPSWDGLTGGLYREEEFAAARTSKTFMSTDPTFTVENFTRVMKKIEPEKREEVWKSLLVWISVLELTMYTLPHQDSPLGGR